MGYVRERPVYRLVFEDEDMAGLTVRVRSLSFGEALTLDQRVSNEHGRVDLAKAAAEFFSVFVEWDLEELDGDGGRVPVPGTEEGLYRQDRLFVRKVLLGWLDSIWQVPGPLDKRSPNGSRSLEESISMEALSESL